MKTFLYYGLILLRELSNQIVFMENHMRTWK
jgi:hypothetical protein